MTVEPKAQSSLLAKGASVTDQQQQPTILCISTYEKGQLFMQEVARLGVNVVLLTVDKLEHADWPRESISKLVTMPENLTPQQVLNTVSYLARENQNRSHRRPR